MALSLLCGGLGVANAEEGTVDVQDIEATETSQKVYTAGKVDTLLAEYGKKTDVENNQNNIKNLQNTTTAQGQSIATNTADIANNKAAIENKINTETANERFATKDALRNLQSEVTGKVDENTFENALNDKADKTYVDAEVGKKADKTYVDTELAKKANATALDTKADKDTVAALDVRVGGVEGKVAALETTVNDPSKGLVKKVTDLKTKTTQISFDPAKGTIVNGVDFMAQEVDVHGKGLTDVSTLHTTGAATIGGALTAAGVNAGTEAITGGSLSVTGAVTGSSVNAGSGEIKTTGVVNAGTLSTTGNATVGGALTAAGVNAGTEAITGGSLSVTGAVKGSSVDAGAGEIKTTGAVNAGTLNTTGDATVGGKLGVTGATTLDGTLTANGEATFEKNVTMEKNLEVKGTLNTKDVAAETIHISKSEDNTVYKSKGKIIGEGGNLSVSNEKYYKSTNITKESQLNVNEEGTVNWATSTDGTTGNVTEGRSEVAADHIKNSVKKTEGGKTFGYEENITADGKVGTVTDEEGNTSSTRQDSKGIYGYAKDKDGNKSYTKQEGNRIAESVIGQDGKQTKSEMTSTDITNTAKDGTITNTAKNVTNEGTESVTNKVGANEVKVSSTDGVDITAEVGKKITESVGTASRVVENDKITDTAGNSTVTTENGKGTTFGKDGSTDTTNIYGNSIKTGTIKAKDTTTDKLTAGAAAGANGGRLTVDANDGVKGSYTSGDYTSRSYILPNTLQSGVDNGKDITDNGFVGSRTDHYMYGDKAKLNETVKDADGSNVTKKTSTKTYTEIKDTNGNTLSVNQKADGNNYKLEDQDGNTNHVTNSATQSKQTLKDKDGNTLTTNQTATKNNFDLKSADGSKENHTTNTVDESRVAIKGENGKAELSTTDEGTTFKHSAAKEAFTEGGATNTTIKGNTITTGKVTMDYADVMKDLGVRGNANITGKTTTGSLEVTGTSTLKGEVTMESNATVKNNLTVGGTTTTKTLKVTDNAEVGGTLDVTGKATFKDSVDIAKDLAVGGNATIKGDVTAKSYKVGDKTYISADGINANDQKITDVADGSISEGSKDAVNGGQLYGMKTDLEHKVDKVGANAAAMANLHPMEFDPDSKWNIAAAMGNYGSETATAIGAFYRPNEDVMVNFSTAFGTGENMVGGGVSVRLGKGGNKLSRQESNALKAQVNDLTARMDALLSVLNPNMSKDFPDVPENHWAYEAVSRLAGNDIVQGYPDGEFHGERTMTRYEMAEIIYNALSRGAEAEKELVEEFKPELQAMAASEKATAEKAEG